ncbi:MAG: hypothetical protein KKB51_03575 [Candidatus Riflebacteria bacterium]|nr:hypothetical protein [Candidatus Riflebacteria bacterium]
MATDFPVPFPLATGTVWVYTADVKSESDGKELNETLSWTTEITSVVERENIVIARGSGLPTDLCFYEKDVKPAPFLIVMVGLWKLYVIQNEERVKEIWEKAISDESLREFVTEADLLLDFPLVVGKSFGETSQILSGNSMFVYTVEGKTPFVASSVIGLNATEASDEFSITLPTNSDMTTWKFTQGIGFTGFAYSHHGSTSEVNCNLIELRRGK